MADKHDQDETQRNHDAEWAEGGEEQERDLYGAELERYQAILDRSLDEALSRYGFTLHHSLPPVRQVELMQQLGFKPKDAVDHYNLAGAAIAKEDFKGAVSQLQKALSLDGTFADAVYNLALCHEKLGKKQDAVQMWNRYIELTEGDEEKATVKAHLAELTA
ncbi:MAG: tetratricopeptide repeat protein [Candidatus Sumerlaeaceae bacterium]|nr:tetratricopeptide repeat protein [Candidatus Sumerlaeaceae bacterium]